MLGIWKKEFWWIIYHGTISGKLKNVGKYI